MSSDPTRPACPWRPAGQPGPIEKVGISSCRSSRGQQRMQRSFQLLLHPPESHGNARAWEAGGEEAGHGSQWGHRVRWPTGLGRLERGRRRIQLRLLAIPFLSPSLPAFRGCRPPQTSPLQALADPTPVWGTLSSPFPADPRAPHLDSHLPLCPALLALSLPAACQRSPAPHPVLSSQHQGRHAVGG